MRKNILFHKLLAVICDLIIAGVLLCIFALFHHVIPQKGNTENALAIPKPTSSIPAFSLPGISTPQVHTPTLITTPKATATIPYAAEKTPDSTTPTATQTIQPTDAKTPEPTVMQTPSVIQTETSYRSNNIVVNMKTVQTGSGKSIITYHVADIYVTNVECLRSAFAEQTYGQNYAQSVLNQDKENNAVVAISGDSYGLSDTGIVLRNGILYKFDNTGSDICVLYYDGRMETLSPGEYTKESLIANGAYQVWSFGPGLLDESGKAKTRFNADKYITKSHPRASIGYYAPGHYVFVLVDGRQDDYSTGMTLTELAELYEELGCAAAYNLDGGISAVMTFNDNIFSHPARTRDVSDIIYVGEILQSGE